MGLSILGWIIIGAISGWLASKITGTGERQGCLLDIIVGIVGAFLGGLLLSALGGVGITGFNPWSFFVATVGAVLLLFLLQLFR